MHTEGRKEQTETSQEVGGNLKCQRHRARYRNPFEGHSVQTGPVGTRLCQFAQVWAEQIQDPWAMKIIQEDHRWEFLNRPGCSTSVIETLLKARAATTNKTYSKVWERFDAFSRYKGFDPLAPQEAQVLEFLQTGLEMANKYTEGADLDPVGSDRSEMGYPPVSATIPKGLRHSPTSGKLICAPMGITNSARNVVPEYIFLGTQATSLWSIKMKAVFLIAIKSGRRDLDIQALGYKPPYCCHLPNRVVLRTLPQLRPKVNK